LRTELLRTKTFKFFFIPQLVSLQVDMAAIEVNEIYHMVELDEKPEAGR